LCFQTSFCNPYQCLPVNSSLRLYLVATCFYLPICYISLCTLSKMLPIQIVKNINTYILYSINLFRNVCRISDKLENMTEQDIPQIITKYMRFAYWITKLSDTHSNNMQYVLLFKDTNGYANAPQYYVILTLHVRCSDVRTGQLINRL